MSDDDVMVGAVAEHATEDMSTAARSYVVWSSVDRFGPVGAIRAILERCADPVGVLAAVAADREAP